MSRATGLVEDLHYLKDKYDLDANFIDALTTSPDLARKHIHRYRLGTYFYCILPTLFIAFLIVIGLNRSQEWIGFFIGSVCSIWSYHFVVLFCHKNKTIAAVTRIANYHNLI